MKKLILITFLFHLTGIINAQDFSFKVFFSDSQGNHDTLVIGYDKTATDSIDPSFGEINILNQPWDSVFEARLSPVDFYLNTGPLNNYFPTFQTKKQILYFDPQPPYNNFNVFYSSAVLIEVKSKYGRPILKWSSDQFMDSSRIHSAFDFLDNIICPPPLFTAALYDSINMLDDPALWMADSSFYLLNGDTIWLIAFGFSSWNTTSINDFDQDKVVVNVFPNPVQSRLNMSFNQILSEEFELHIISSSGIVVRKHEINANSYDLSIDVSDLQSGIYFYRIFNSKKMFSGGKFLKE